MGTSNFSGPINSVAGFQNNGIPLVSYGSANAVDVTASTLTADASTHSGKLVTLNRAAGITVTLPAASGTGNMYRFYVGTSASGGSYVIKVANSSDTMVGMSVGGTLAGTGSFVDGVGSTDDTITLNGGTTGGLVGSYVELVDQATNVWYVRAALVGSGTMATAFSATV